MARLIQIDFHPHNEVVMGAAVTWTPSVSRRRIALPQIVWADGTPFREANMSAYNQEVGNQAFAVKRARFTQSNVVLTREVGEYAQWGETQIRERGERLAEEAAQLWPGPKEPFAGGPESAYEEEARQVRLAFWNGFVEHLSQAHPELPNVEPEPKRVVHPKSGLSQVRIVLRFRVQYGSVALVLKFKREARLLWRVLRDTPELPNSWVGQEWQFDEGEGIPAGESSPRFLRSMRYPR